MSTLKDVTALRAETERLWALELEAKRKAVAAQRIWKAALREHYGERLLEIADCDT